MFFFLMIRRPPRSTLFPTRRSSDLLGEAVEGLVHPGLQQGGFRQVVRALRFLVCDKVPELGGVVLADRGLEADRAPADADRKSTRLNSSHANISYAVFCLKKKKLQS